VVAKEMNDGEEISRMIGPGENFAGLSLLSARSPASFQSRTSCDIVWLQGEQLKVLMTQDADLSRAIAKLMV